ncbi:hypothetical protein, partial [Rhizobium ruizarguesonis]|uniref:hypothetical protein n=1 Tax=Rhizobium ruizarguesonis TaxID=2081791 RepID=UPI001A8C9106
SPHPVSPGHHPCSGLNAGATNGHQRSTLLPAKPAAPSNLPHLRPKQGILTRFNNYKLLILQRSHPDMEANPDFSFVTALLSVFSTSLPIGRFGGREAVELVRDSYRKRGLDLNSTFCYPIPTPNSQCTCRRHAAQQA